MTVHLRTSNDSGLAQLNGAGTLIAALDAILVNGHGSVSISSLTRSGTVATAVTATAHGLITGRVVRINGANESAYNGTVVVTVIDGFTFTYTVAGSPATPATGTIYQDFPPLGWSKVFTGTNKAVYRAPTGNRMYLRVDDSNSIDARVIGYENMTDVDTGTGPFPTTAQISGGYYWGRTSSAGTGRAWHLVSNGTLFWLNVDHNGVSNNSHILLGFGDFTSYKAGDSYNCILLGNTGIASGLSQGYNGTLTGNYIGANVYANNGGCAVPRNYSQAGAAVQYGRCIDTSRANAVIANQTVYNGGVYINVSFERLGRMSRQTYPNPIDGSLSLCRVMLNETATGVIPGYLPGLYNPMHNKIFSTTGDIIDGNGPLAGQKLYVVNGRGEGADNSAQWLLEISQTW